MILTKVTLLNFGPYYGSHSIDLSVTDAAPVIVVHGENERGKTSLANAIRWCLYKEVLEHEGGKINTVDLMNWEALDSGSYNMSVAVEYRHENSMYKLVRHVQASHRPMADTDLQWHASLFKDDAVQSQGTIDRRIKDTLAKGISKFFLFDGEFLAQFKSLLRSSERGSAMIQSSIEQILGVPALSRLRATLGDLLAEVENRQLAETKARRATERLVANVQQKQDAVDGLSRDISNARELRDRLEEQKDDLRKRRSAYAESEADLRRLDQLDEALVALVVEKAATSDNIKSLVAEGWYAPLEIVLAGELAQAEMRFSDHLKEQTEEIHARALQQAMIESLGRDECVLCGQGLTEAEQATLAAAIDASMTGAHTPAPDSIEREAVRLSTLRLFVPKFATIAEADKAARRQHIESRRLEHEREEIRQRVRDDHRQSVADIEDEYDKCVEHLGQVSRLIQEQVQRLAEAEQSLRKLRAEVRSLPEANPRLAAEAEIYAALRNITSKSLEDFRVALRTAVESEANRIHSQLTTEPEYAGLKINEKYGLGLYNRQGRNILRRSAGSEHIVALSLIGALNHCATREGPIVMDTPFGRLDRGHRSRILDYLPKFGPQVVLLVQSGEIERDRDLASLRPYINHEYEILRDGASDRSRIAAVEASNV